MTECPICGAKIDARIRTEQMAAYTKKHLDRVSSYQKYDKSHKQERAKATNERLRAVIFNIISGNDPKCVRCGCTDKRFLEINHKNGGGGKEMKGGLSAKFYWDIYMGRRETGDLELLCRPCNAIPALELKFGLVSLRVVCDGVSL